MKNNDIVSQIVKLWKQGRTLPQIEEQLSIVIQISNEEKDLHESITRGEFTVKNLLLG
jgi:hypothetical protein